VLQSIVHLFLAGFILIIQCSSKLCELHICLLYVHILRIRVCLYTHIRTYMHACMSLCYAWPQVSLCEALLDKQRSFLECKKREASTQNLHSVKNVNESLNIQVFNCFTNSPTNYRLLTLAWSLAAKTFAGKLKQSLVLLILTRLFSFAKYSGLKVNNQLVAYVTRFLAVRLKNHVWSHHRALKAKVQCDFSSA